MNRYQRWRLNRRTRQERSVLTAISRLKPEEASGWTISRLASLGVGAVYPVLIRLEAAGTITSRWVDGPHPRRRVYQVAEEALYADPQPDGRTVWRCRGCRALLRADKAGAPTGVRHMPNCGEPHQHTTEEAT